MTAPARPLVTALHLYDAGLKATTAGNAAPVELCDELGQCELLPLQAWCAEYLAGDPALLDRCSGATLDVGCGPGRLTAALGRRGLPALGIDISAAAVELTRARGAAAVRASIFAPAPPDTRWDTVLLADGNIGIGGDPLALLLRAKALLTPHGRIVVELNPATTTRIQRLQLRWRAERSEFFDWASVAPDTLAALAAGTGLSCHDVIVEEGRWFGILTR
jgi:SAM-dependent methyltransferase